jgi:hypothetical protein
MCVLLCSSHFHEAHSNGGFFVYASAPRTTRRARAGLSALILARSAMLLVLLLTLAAGSTWIAHAFSNPFALSSLDGSNGFTIDGIARDDEAGYSVSGAGDVNGDGIDDLIIGAPQVTPNFQTYVGASYVVFGGSSFSSSLDLANLDGTNGFVIQGIDFADSSGFSVSGAGDVNNDGYDDVIIGSPDGDPDGRDSAGESYVVFGGSGVGSSGTLDLVNLDGSNGFVIKGIYVDGQAGYSVSGAGDVNNDNYDDMIIGARKASPNNNDRAGESYVVFGGNNFNSSLDLASLNGSNGFVLPGIDAGDWSGWSVSGAGDVNNDNFDDLIIGARNASPNNNYRAGESYVVFGGNNFNSSLDLASLDGSNGFVINGIESYDDSGQSVSGAGDVNNDGVDDFIIGASGADPAGVSGAGSSYVIFGRSNLSSVDLASLDGSNGFVINGIDQNDFSGISVSGAGDVNSDGFDDIIIGAYLADQPGENDAGESYVIFGGKNFNSSLALANLNGNNGFVLTGVDFYDDTGYSVSGAGDINNDGIADVIIGAPGVGGSGASYVVFGEPYTIPLEVSIGAPSPTITNNEPVTFDITVSGADTINLAPGDVTLNTTTGSVTGNVSVSGGTTSAPTVTVDNLSGDGTFTISIAEHPQDILSRGCFLFAHIPHPDALQPFCARSRPLRRTGASAHAFRVVE